MGGERTVILRQEIVASSKTGPSFWRKSAPKDFLCGHRIAGNLWRHLAENIDGRPKQLKSLDLHQINSWTYLKRTTNTDTLSGVQFAVR